MIMIINYNFSLKKTSDIGPSIYRHPENRTSSPGDHVVFTCAVEGLPAPSIIWLRDGLEVTDRKAKIYQGRDSIISELHIASVEKHHFGKYTCQAANTIGIVVSKDAMLSLAGKRPLPGKYSAPGGGGGGGGGVVPIKRLHGEAPSRGPTSYPATFHNKGTPFVYLLLANSTPFTYLAKNVVSLLTAVNALSF